MALVRSVATVGGYTMLSRLTGFARDMLMAAVLGAGPVADAFFVAFKLPNFFRRLFAEGAFNAAFVPLFAARLHNDGKAEAKRFAEDVASVLVVVLFLFVTALQIAMPWVMLIFAPGWHDERAKFDLAVELARLAFPYLLFISLVSFFGGVLNTLGRFAAVAGTPILLNVVMVGAIIWLTPYVKTPGHALAWGVAVAGAVQFLWLAVSMRQAGMSLHLRWPRLTPGVKRLLTLILPGALGAGVVQVNLFVDIVIASLLPTGSITFLYYADRINQLPVGVVGVAVGTALLPLLSRQIRQGDDAAAKDSLNRAIEIALLLALPAAAASIVIAEPIIATLFQRGAFTQAESARDRGGADRLFDRAAGLCPDQGAGTRLFRPRGHQDAGAHRGRLRRSQLPAEPDPGPRHAARPCRHRALDRHRRLGEHGAAGRHVASARLLRRRCAAQIQDPAHGDRVARHGGGAVDRPAPSRRPVGRWRGRTRRGARRPGCRGPRQLRRPRAADPGRGLGRCEKPAATAARHRAARPLTAFG